MLQFSILTIGTFVTMLDSITMLVSKQCFKKDINNVIPIFSLVYGLILGIAGFYTPNVDMGANIIEAIAIGLSAGAAATGVDQVGKQLKKNDDMSAIISYLKKFVDSIDVSEDIEEVPDIDLSDTDVPESDDQCECPEDPDECDENPDDYSENE